MGFLTDCIARFRIPNGTPLTYQAASKIAADTDRGADALMIRFVGLAIAMNGSTKKISIRESASTIVHLADLHTLPDCPPKLLRAPFIVEIARPIQGESLFGDTTSIGVFSVDDKLIIVGVGEEENLGLSFEWSPRWGELLDVKITFDDKNPHHLKDMSLTWPSEVARYIVLLGLMLEASESPLECAKEKDFTRVRLRSSYSSSITKNNSIETIVSGHLKRQPYGPRSTLRRWQWISAYAARKWVAPSSIKIRK